jgi:dimethylargininase
MTISGFAPSATAVAKRFGGHSNTATLRRVMVRKPTPPRSATDATNLGYLHAVDIERSEQQHAAFVQILRDEEIEIVEAGPDAPGSLDAVFAYDPSFMTNQGAILMRMGKELRRVEATFHADTYADLGIPIIGSIKDPGMVEGGDVLWLDDRTLAVGRGYRTNQEGIRQLRNIVRELDIDVLAYDLPHWHGVGECMHLMSMLSPVASDLAVVYLPLMAVALVEELKERAWRIVEVPDEEFDSMGCNVLALAPGRCLMIEGNPETRRRLEKAGCEVLTYQGDEISLNRGGGPTCLTRPLWREETAET